MGGKHADIGHVGDLRFGCKTRAACGRHVEAPLKQFVLACIAGHCIFAVSAAAQIGNLPQELQGEWTLGDSRKVRFFVRDGKIGIGYAGKKSRFFRGGVWTSSRLVGELITSYLNKRRIREVCPKVSVSGWQPLALTMSGDGSRLTGRYITHTIRTDGTNDGVKLCQKYNRRQTAIVFRQVKPPKPAFGQLQIVTQGTGVLAPAGIALVLDASGSMAGRLPDGSRKIDVAKRVMRSVIRALPAQAKIGLRVYGHRYRSRPKRRSCADTQLIVPFGAQNRARLIDAINGLRPKGQTPIGLSLARLAGDFRGAAGFKLVVLVSDGIETCSPRPRDRYYPIKVVRQLQTRGLKIRVNVIGFDVGRSRTQAFLKQIAIQGGGGYFGATNARQLKDALKQAFAISYIVYTRAGRVLAKGSVGGPAVKLMVGTYRVVISGASTLTVSNVNIRKGRETLLRVTRLGGKNQVERSTR
jgi:hypothetical protein